MNRRLDSPKTTSVSPSRAAVETTTEEVMKRLPSLFQNASRDEVPRETDKSEVVTFIVVPLFIFLYVVGMTALCYVIRKKRKRSQSRQPQQQNQNATVETGDTPSSAGDVTLLRVSQPSAGPAPQVTLRISLPPSAPAAAGTPSAPAPYEETPPPAHHTLFIESTEVETEDLPHSASPD